MLPSLVGLNLNTMNNLKPELSWIEGRCYRMNDASGGNNLSTFQEHDLYESGDVRNCNSCELEGDDEEYEIEQMDESRYKTSFYISRHYLGSVIGRKGSTKQRIEHETRTEIKIPRQGQHGDVVIMGTNAANVKAARRRLNMIVVSSRLKQKPTHFISIPMNSSNIIENFRIFKETILREYKDSGIEEFIFVPEMKLHVTAGVMCLMDNEERVQVSELLTQAKDKVIMPLIKDHLPLTIRLRGISYMNDDPKNIHVLYGNVREENAPEGILQQLADTIVRYFDTAGFMDKGEFNNDSVKLHVTLMNTRYRITNKTSDQSWVRRVPFDGTRILDKFGDYDFGTAQLTDIHLSLMNDKNDGYYTPTCVLSLC